MIEITDTNKFLCAERELKYRERVYPRMVDSGKMTAAAAAREIALMTAIMEDYRVPSEQERLL